MSILQNHTTIWPRPGGNQKVIRLAMADEAGLYIVPLNYGYSYASIIGTGTPVFLDDPKEKAAGLRVLMKHQTGRPFEISEQMTQGTAVFRIDVDGLSAKTNISK